MNYLIDTNVISEIRKGAQCSANVTAWYEGIEDNSLYLSVLILGEIRKGVERARPKDPAKARNLEKWLVAVASAFSERVLPIDVAVAEEWGRMNAIRPVPVIDGMLAASAKVHGMTLVTRNISDVADLGAAVFNPFEFELSSLYRSAPPNQTAPHGEFREHAGQLRDGVMWRGRLVDS